LKIEFLEFFQFTYHILSEAGRSDASVAEQETAKNALKRPISSGKENVAGSVPDPPREARVVPRTLRREEIRALLLGQHGGLKTKTLYLPHAFWIHLLPLCALFRAGARLWQISNRSSPC
jgi:hypothetical protein